MPNHCRTVNLGDTRLRIRTEMNTTHKLDEMATPEMTAKAWDDYLRRCVAYLGTVRFFRSRRDTQSVVATRHSVRVRVVWTVQPHQSRPVRAGMAQAA